MKKKLVRAGIAGSGFAASFHYEALRRLYSAEVEVVGVCSRTKKHAESFAQDRGLKAFEQVEPLLDQVDVIHICASTWAHEQIAVAALERDKFAIVEKPLTGYFGDGSEDFNGETFPKEQALEAALAATQRMLEAEKKSKARILYAENWVYAPSIQKEREILEKTRGQILWMHGEEAHSGSHSPAYGIWKLAGGGSLMGKSCHPLTAALYLKRVEGRTRDGKPVRPKSVTARTHKITRSPAFRDEGHLRTDYTDVEDFGFLHVTFEDGTIADVFSSEIVMGGVHNWLEIVGNNHRTICHINPTNSIQCFNPVEENFRDIYVVEKTSTKQGWSSPSPDEDWFTGYQQEMEAFYRYMAEGGQLEGDSGLAADTVSVIYSGYVSAERAGAEVKVKQL